MRSQQLLKLLQRVPTNGAAVTEVARSAFASNAFSSNSLVGRKGEELPAAKGTAFKQTMAMPQLSFAAHMSSLREEEREQKAEGTALAQANLNVSKVPTALVALPARKHDNLRASMQTSRALATATAITTGGGHDHHEPHYVDHGRVHPYHILPPSPWPLLCAWGMGNMFLGLVGWFHGITESTAVMYVGTACTAMTATAWWRDCIIESDMGMHTEMVKRNLMLGVWLFIASEAMFFFGLLWSCIHLGMAPTVHVQMQWPPVGIIPVGWDKRALVMSAVLAASYYSANVAMVAKDPKIGMAGLGVTTALGFMFLADQYIEYNELPFTISDGPYGTTFYMTTGFHGLHVLLGAIWLAVSMAMYPRYNKPGVGMKGAVLYWHFVDIVWIAVYGIIYLGQY